jgi:hypothetical protein
MWLAATTPPPVFAQVLIVKGVEVVCLHTLLQVLIPKEMEAAGKVGQISPTVGAEFSNGPRLNTEKNTIEELPSQ